jgi:hypothetical protein
MPEHPQFEPFTLIKPLTRAASLSIKSEHRRKIRQNKEFLLVRVANCPKCGTIIPELQGAVIIAF